MVYRSPSADSPLIPISGRNWVITRHRGCCQRNGYFALRARPALLHFREQSGVDHDLGPSDVARFVGGQEHDGVADIDGLDPRHR